MEYLDQENLKTLLITSISIISILLIILAIRKSLKKAKIDFMGISANIETNEKDNVNLKNIDQESTSESNEVNIKNTNVKIDGLKQKSTGKNTLEIKN